MRENIVISSYILFLSISILIIFILLVVASLPISICWQPDETHRPTRTKINRHKYLGNAKMFKLLSAEYAKILKIGKKKEKRKRLQLNFLHFFYQYYFV